MFKITDEEFEEIVKQAIDRIPEKYAKNIKNLAFVVEEEPSEDQSRKLNLHHGMMLYGLYEGIPLTKRTSGYNLVLPDKITIFKRSIEIASQNMEELVAKVSNTVWHEVAHYYGLDHGRIHELESS